MALGHRCLTKELSKFLTPLLHAGNCCKKSSKALNLVALSIMHMPSTQSCLANWTQVRGFREHRISTKADRLREPTTEIDLLSFIKASLNEFEGTHHYWLNRSDNQLFGADGIILILSAMIFDFITLEKLKTIQKRFPHINIMGLKAIHSSSDEVHFPILLSWQKFRKVVSTDESSNCLFFSDCNHHRILVSDGNGEIQDCIGSSPGFEDGDFESAKLRHPAGSYYHATEHCLYFVDSENHAIRKADMAARTVETLYPTSASNKGGIHVWNWIMSRLGLENSEKTNVEERSEVFDSKSLYFPWHLLKSVDDSLYIMDRRFQTLWIMDINSGKIDEVFEVGQRILKVNRESGVCSHFRLSNLGILGLPYWLNFPLETFYAGANGLSGTPIDHLQHFDLLPGKIDIHLRVDVPIDIELVVPLQKSCIWCQARGAATESSTMDEDPESLYKAGLAQKWYDELDDFAAPKPESEVNVQDDNLDKNSVVEDEKVCFSCGVCTSPGTSEVIIYATLYCKLRRDPNSNEGNQKEHAARILDILSSKRSGKIQRDYGKHFYCNLRVI